MTPSKDAPCSPQAMSSEATGSEEVGPAACGEQAQPVLVSLSEASAVNVVEVNMYELLSNAVAFIPQDKHPGAQA